MQQMDVAAMVESEKIKKTHTHGFKKEKSIRAAVGTNLAPIRECGCFTKKMKKM